MIDEHALQMRLKHDLSFISPFALYAPTQIHETEEEVPFGKLNLILDQCLSQNMLIVLGD